MSVTIGQRHIDMIRAKLFEEALVEMGKRVGLEWSNYDDVLEYQKQHGVTWYTSITWTKEQQMEFKDWMDSLLNKKSNWSSRKRDLEVWTFLLCYGWKIEQEPIYDENY